MSELDPTVQRRIIAVAAKTLDLKVNVVCLVKTEFASSAGHDVPLGSVLVLFILRMRDMPVWWWRKSRVYKAVRATVPSDRMVFVRPISQGYIRAC